MEDAEVNNSGTATLRRLASIVPRTRKQRYLLSLSEDDFRDRVVRPIFLQQGFTDGRETCGVSERGKDCYFTKTSNLGGTDVFVIQTKKGKITKAATPSENLDSIVTQLRMALESPVALIKEKRKVRPTQAFLVASGEINDSAQQHIVDEIRDPRLKFVDVEILIPLIDKYLPELWSDVHSDSISYFRALTHAIEHGSDILPGGVILGDENANIGVLDDTYANLDVIRTSARKTLPGERLPKKTEQSKIQSIPASSLPNVRERLVLLQGDGGSGKSTVMKRIAYDMARRPVESGSDVRIPLLLRARDIAADSSRSLLDHAIGRVMALNPALKQPYNMQDLNSGRVYILLDGLDEVTSEEATKAVLERVAEFHSKYPRCKVVVSSRNTATIRSLTGLKSYATYFLTSLDITQASKIVRSLSKGKSLSPEDSSEILRRLQDVHGITISPLIVMVFVETSDEFRSDLPPNITELFKKYTELMLGKWEEGKKFHQQIQAPIKALVLQQVAFKMHERRLTSLPVDEFKELVYAELRRRGYPEDTPLMYHEMVERSGLFRVDSQRIEFSHLLFQEFFAGRAIPDFEFVDKNIGDEWWKLPIVFFFGDHPGDHPKDIAALDAISRGLDTLPPQDALIVALTLGLSLQACYFAPVDDKHGIYERIIKSLVETRHHSELSEVKLHFPFLLLAGLFSAARESLALSNLRFFVAKVYEALKNAFADSPEKLDDAQFWLIIGLLEAGLYDLAKDYVEALKPRDSLLLMFVDLELAMSLKLRVVSGSNRTALTTLRQMLKEKIKPRLGGIRSQLSEEARAYAQLTETPDADKEREELPS